MVHPAVPDEQHPARPAGGGGGVGDHQHRLARPVDLGEQVHEAVRRPGVQRAGGFVRQHDLGLGDEGPGHGAPLLLPAGHLVGVLFQQGLDAQGLRQGGQPPHHLLVLLPRQHQGEQDIVPEGEGVQQVEVLEHEAQVIPAEGGQLLFPEADQIPPAQQDGAVGGLIQSGQDVQQGGLAGAGLAHNGHVLSLLHGEGHVGQGLHLVAAEAGGVDFLHMIDFQD